MDASELFFSKSKPLKCVICRCPRPESSPEEKVIFNQFCEKFLPCQRSYLWRGNDFKSPSSSSSSSSSVCSNCSESMHTAMDTKSRMEVVEGRVRKLQQQVIQELRELQIYLDLLGWQLGKIEGKMKEGEDQVDGGIHGRRRGQIIGLLSLPSGDASVNGGGASDDDGDNLLRKFIGNVTSDLRTFQNGLKRRVSCGAGPAAHEDIRGQPSAKRVRVGGGGLKTLEEMEDVDDLLVEHEPGDNYGSGGDIDDDDPGESDISDSGHLPQIQGCTTGVINISSTLVGSPSQEDKGSDNDNSEAAPRGSTRSGKRTLLIKRIKLEPGTGPVDNGASASDNETSDDDEEDHVILHPNPDNDNKTVAACEEFHRDVLIKLKSAHKKLNEQGDLIHSLTLQVGQLPSQNKVPELDNTFSFPAGQFPLKNLADVTALEELIAENNDAKDKLVYTLSTTGGGSVDEAVKRMMKTLLAEEVASNMVLKGANLSEKATFCTYQSILGSMLDALASNVRLKGLATKDNLDKSIQRSFKQAADRIFQRKNRKQAAKSQSTPTTTT